MAAVYMFVFYFKQQGGGGRQLPEWQRIIYVRIPQVMAQKQHTAVPIYTRQHCGNQG